MRSNNSTPRAVAGSVPPSSHHRNSSARRCLRPSWPFVRPPPPLPPQQYPPPHQVFSARSRVVFSGGRTPPPGSSMLRTSGGSSYSDGGLGCPDSAALFNLIPDFDYALSGLIMIEVRHDRKSESPPNESSLLRPTPMIMWTWNSSGRIGIFRASCDFLT